MKSRLIIALITLAGTGLTGCADNHIMHMKNGNTVVVQGKPHTDKASGMVIYTDENGTQQAVSKADIKDISNLKN
ncbi:YgdI/YgdR family lipoprotein [Erwinia psidii]|uniref:YgdI/YgdR family lipoprotein n=2 Tax=Erwinia psidii TaxID=69224 RepID=A0A3N6TR28_9GAMM|nr:YgdI/YgdR family lipoprotein [Erwinia psidii]MCX8961622.1 YgdI/YgdR family lipoprotein [Erwinia psidii]MCX8965722.1 YgdI/YgdR family lipoprotein [Erwinia psidii]RQM37702.1 YgdI/YgdR family lipoprotein [Erwinia psidii]